MRRLLIEPSSGISGDMFVAAAAALAGCENEIVALPQQLGLPQVRCTFHDVKRCGLVGRKFDVLEGDNPVDGGPAPTDRASPPEHRHTRTSELGSLREAGAQGHDSNRIDPHGHRPLSAIRELITHANLPPAVRDRSLRMLKRLGSVEAEAHGIPIERVHFHEIGAIDSVVDIVAAALCIERLAVGGTLATPVCVGSGTVKTAHGVLPVPAPATERLLRGMPTFAGDLPGEWTTPTGALILAELQPTFASPVIVTVAGAAGAGGRDTSQRPNLLRLRLVESPNEARPVAGIEEDELVAIETNVDDSSGELLGAAFVDLLLKAGARDVVIRPVIMKKGRPGHQLEVLAEPGIAPALAQLILTETSTIGVRLTQVHRLKLPRESVTVSTPYGDILAKRVRLPDGTARTHPEYESCREAAGRAGVPVERVYRAAAEALDAARAR